MPNCKETTHRSSANGERCALCRCLVHRTRGTYATDTHEGRSHATGHHLVPQRFLGKSATRRKKGPRTAILRPDTFPTPGELLVFCYECHEELLHNPMLLEEDIRRLAELFELSEASEPDGKPFEKVRLARRIEIFHNTIAEGVRCLLARKQNGG